MPNIFISYSPKDNRHMLTLREQLARNGFTPWIDPEPRPNHDWRFLIDEAIRASEAVLVILTPNSAESAYVTYEWATALALNIPVVPVLFASTRVHPRLETLQRFDMTAFRDPIHFWDNFIRELHRMIPAQHRPHSAPVAIPPARHNTAPLVDRSVRPPHAGFWVVIRKGNPLHMMWELKANLVTLGREATNDIAIEDVGVSRFHCRFVQFGSGYAVEDLNSTNGVLINGIRAVGITPIPIGATLQLGDNIILSFEVVS